VAPAAPRDQAVTADAPQAEPAVPRPTAPDSYAVVIGIEKYRRDVSPADGAALDAQNFALIAEQAFGVPSRNLHLLIDGDATKASIDAQVAEWLPKNANADGDVYFFYAGHGSPNPENKSRYLLPWDADPRYLATQGVDLNALLAHLEKLPARRVYVFLDACFTGGGGRSVLSKGTRPLVLQRRTTAAPRMSNLFLFTATSANEVTGVADDGGGLYSTELFRGLLGAADGNGDGAISVGELHDHTRDAVGDAARRNNRDQVPELLAPIGGRDVILLSSPPRGLVLHRLTLEPKQAEAPVPVKPGPDELLLHFEPPDGRWSLVERIGESARPLCRGRCEVVAKKSAMLEVESNGDSYDVSLDEQLEGEQTVLIAPSSGSVAAGVTLTAIGGVALLTALILTLTVDQPGCTEPQYEYQTRTCGSRGVSGPYTALGGLVFSAVGVPLLIFSSPTHVEVTDEAPGATVIGWRFGGRLPL
jgi:hypothetical protein